MKLEEHMKTVEKDFLKGYYGKNIPKDSPFYQNWLSRLILSKSKRFKIGVGFDNTKIM